MTSAQPNKPRPPEPTQPKVTNSEPSTNHLPRDLPQKRETTAPPPEPTPLPIQSVKTKISTGDHVFEAEFLVLHICNWPFARSESVTCPEGIRDGEDFVKTQLLRRVSMSFRPGMTLVAIGAASEEGRREIEARRAEQRANVLSGWLLENYSGTSIWLLGLGQHIRTCDQDCAGRNTDWQRPVMVALISNANANSNINEIILKALSQESQLPNPRNYAGGSQAKKAP